MDKQRLGEPPSFAELKERGDRLAERTRQTIAKSRDLLSWRSALQRERDDDLKDLDEMSRGGRSTLSLARKWTSKLSKSSSAVFS
jgi:hypothetical protein